MTSTQPMMINCGSHGERVSAVVCCHMIGKETDPVGFVENSNDPNDLQAWCSACEDKFEEQGGMTDAFRQFNGMSVVRIVYFLEAKARHSSPGT